MDPGVTKAAIDAVRKQLRERLGGKVAGPPGASGGGGPPPESAGPPVEGSPPEEGAESPGMEAGEGDAGEVMAMCPNCGFKGPMEPLQPEGDQGAGPPPAAGPPPGPPPRMPPAAMGPPRK